MINHPQTPDEAHAYRYNKWAGNPNGVRYDAACCAYEVHNRWGFRQCARPKGYGLYNLYCKQHAKLLEKRGY